MLKFKKKSAVFGLVCLGLFLAVGRGLALDFPNPKGHVNDFAGLFSSEYTTGLETKLASLEQQTRVQVAVVTVPDLQETTVEDFAVRLFENWGIGKTDEDNGLLILIARDEREVKIEVGYGLEPVLTDGRAGRIIRDQMIPFFKDGDYESGVTEAVNQIEIYLVNGVLPVRPFGDFSGVDKRYLIFFALFGLLFTYLASFLGRSKRAWPGGVIGSIFGWTGSRFLGGGWLLVAVLGLLGLLLDLVFSQNYRKRKESGRPTDWRSSWGGFSSGSRPFRSRSFGGGFGGFGGGSSGGGGAKGSW